MASSLDELYIDIKEAIYNATENEVIDEILEVVQEENEFSYTEYMPKYNGSRYRKEISGSFADGDNYEMMVIPKKNKITLRYINIRQTDCDCEYCQSHSPLFLDYFIENGIAGNYKIHKKPVIERISDRVMMENLLEIALRKGLARQGLNLKR